MAFWMKTPTHLGKAILLHVNNVLEEILIGILKDMSNNMSEKNFKKNV